MNNLGVYLDSGLVMDRQVSKLCQVCYFHLRRLRTVRLLLTKESLFTLVHAFVTSRVDHCNSLLFGSYSHLLDRLQSVLSLAGPENLQVQQHIGCHLRRAPLASNQEKDRLQDRPYGRTLPGWCYVGVSDGTVYHPVGSAVDRQCLWSASRGDLIVPRFRLQTFGHWAFVVSGSQIWFQLSSEVPLNIRQSRDNLLLFKQKLKAHLFQQF